MNRDLSKSHFTGGKSPVRSWDAAIAELARGQHGVVGREQLLDLGMSARAIEGRVEREQLHRLHHGVYKVGYRRISRKGWWLAAVLASGPGACLSHRSAARLLRLFPPESEWAEVTCPSGSRTRRNGIICHQSVIGEDEKGLIDGIPVTSPFRTIFDLAGMLELRGLERAFHEAEVRGLTDRVSLPMLLERYPGRRGARNLRAVLGSDAPIGITRNDFEEAFLTLVDVRGLLRPRMNADLSVRGRFFEIDALWEAQRVAVELDSRGVHGTEKKFESDRQRDRILVAEGWKTFRITWQQLQEEPDEIAADLEAALRSPALTHPH